MSDDERSDVSVKSEDEVRIRKRVSFHGTRAAELFDPSPIEDEITVPLPQHPLRLQLTSSRGSSTLTVRREEGLLLTHSEEDEEEEQPETHHRRHRPDPDEEDEEEDEDGEGGGHDDDDDEEDEEDEDDDEGGELLRSFRELTTQTGDRRSAPSSDAATVSSMSKLWSTMTTRKRTTRTTMPMVSQGLDKLS